MDNTVAIPLKQIDDITGALRFFTKAFCVLETATTDEEREAAWVTCETARMRAELMLEKWGES
jgi:hypothetical protein